MRLGGGTAPPLNRTAAERHNEQGALAEKRGDFDTAESEYNQAIIADSTFARPWNNLGTLAWAVGDSADAERYFRRAIGVDSAYAEAMYNLGTIRWDRGDPAGAETQYRAALRADSSFVPAYSNLGMLLIEHDRAREAADVLDRSLSLEVPEKYHGLVPYLLKNRGLAARALGEDEAARGYWARAVTIDSSIVELHRFLAEWYEDHGRPREARAHWGAVARSSDEAESRLGAEALERLDSD